MTAASPSAFALTPHEAALTLLLEGLAPVAPRRVPLAEAAGLIAAEAPIGGPLPARDVARLDGWACAALDLVGASPYAPTPLARAPLRVAAGEALPPGCDCVLTAERLEFQGPLALALSEAFPGEGARRAGEDLAAGRALLSPGGGIGPRDLLLAEAAGLVELPVRAPRLRLIDATEAQAPGLSTRLAAAWLRAQGVPAASVETCGREAAQILRALEAAESDLTILIGGTGRGRKDHAAEALAAGGGLLVHGLALEPCSSAALGRLRGKPVLALPGQPVQAFAACLALVSPLLDRLASRLAPEPLRLPLARKIASGVGMAELALLRREGGFWRPLGAGDLTLDQMRLAEAWAILAAEDEGCAAGESFGALLLHDRS